LKIVIPATPLAPADKQAAMLSSVMPPIARTGKPSSSRVMARSAANPCGGPNARFDSVEKIGPNTTKSAPPSRAARASSTECVETPIKNSAPHVIRTTSAGKECAVKCTPSAPAARATSTRSLTINRVLLPRVIDTARTTSSNSARALNDFSRI